MAFKDSKIQQSRIHVNFHPITKKPILSFGIKAKGSNKTKLLKAYNSSLIKFEEILKRREINPNFSVTDIGGTLLNLAIYENAIDKIKILLKYGADPCLENKDELSPFLYAVLEKKYEILSLFKDKKKVLNSISSKEENALRVAFDNQDFQMIELLLMLVRY